VHPDEREFHSIRTVPVMQMKLVVYITPPG
jgi:hypothetical protein